MPDIPCQTEVNSRLEGGRRQLTVSPVAEPCPPEAAACLQTGSKPVSLGRVSDGPQWIDGVIVLKYVDGSSCPDRIRKKSTTIRFTCSESQVVSDTASSALGLQLQGQSGSKGQ